MSFVHLRVHTQYSLLHGAIRTDDLIDRVKELQMSAVAISDTHNLFGAVEFYKAALDQKIKPIIGCELHYSTEARSVEDRGQARAFALPVYCKDIQAYRNLCQIVTKSYLEIKTSTQKPGVHKPMVTRDLLNEWGDGLIVLSGDLKSEIGWHWIKGDEDEAIKKIEWFKKRFKDDFYLELSDSGLPEQDAFNEQLYEWGQKFKIPVVATSNCHYLKPEDAEAHELLMCIEVGKRLDFDRQKSLVPAEFYLKSPELMRARFERFAEAADNTLKIAEKCNVEFQFKDSEGKPIYHLPIFRPEGVKKGDPFDLITYFKDQATEGLEKRFLQKAFSKKVSAPDWDTQKVKYDERLNSELAMIEKTGFSGYFLIVADFINWAKNTGIPVGPGRGSGAGSLVAYSLGITDLDPIHFGLLFERFINPERISMPDFDVDFCQDRRGEVIQYVSQKWGADNVCQIITFGKLQTKAALKDVCRVMGFSFADSDLITKLIPHDLGISIQDAIDKEPRIRERIESEPKIAKVFEYALKLEGLCRNAGIHAAGVIITERPVVEYCPLYVGKDGDVVTQFDKDFAEAVGLIKFDFLGLKTLTVIDQACKIIGAATGEAFRIDSIDYDDAKVFELISSGDTDGVFQVESSGMKDLCQRIKPNTLDDITAINALYRPGPLGSGMVDDFIDRKHGRKEMAYELPQLESILKETYGVILYQEQVMQIARELAGYSLGQADLLRRAMGKKKAEEMAEHREIFVAGALKSAIPQNKASAIFDLMAKFAEYGFNKSHSAAYGVITYQTAWLKTYHSAEFMAALMTTEMDATEKLSKYIGDCRMRGLKVLPPSVNRSQRKFSVEDDNGKKAIRFGLEAIKGVGGIAVDVILESREQGPFQNVQDFLKRVSTRKVNKKVMESLIQAGALDSIAEANRPTLMSSLPTLFEMVGEEQAEREMGQTSLFDHFQSTEIQQFTPADRIFKLEEDWPLSKKLAQEKQIVGFYVSGHPMDKWQKLCEDWLGWSVDKIKVMAEQKQAELAAGKAPEPEPQGEWTGGRYLRPKRPEIKIAGLIADLREVTTKKGDRMGIASLEDLKGKIEVIIFPKVYAEVAAKLKTSHEEAEPVVLTAEIELSEESPKLFANGVRFAKELHDMGIQKMVVKIQPSRTSPDQLRALKKSFIENRGKCPVRIDFVDQGFRTTLDLPTAIAVDPSPLAIQGFNAILGHDSVVLTRSL